MVADTPSTKIQLKAFHAEIVTDFKAIEKEEAGFVDIPVIRKVTPEDIEDVFLTIKEDIIRPGRWDAYSNAGRSGTVPIDRQ